jgi:hypothetical protein
MSDKVLKKALVSSFLFLFFGNLLLRPLFPSIVFWIIGFCLIIFLVIRRYIESTDEFGIVLFMFFVSHFDYASNQGGLFNIVALMAILLLRFIKNIPVRLSTKSFPIVNFLFIILFTVNLLGLIFISTVPIGARLSGFMVIVCYTVVFFFIIKQDITPARLKVLIILMTILAVYNFLVALNQRTGRIFINSPMFPLVLPEKGYSSTMAAGTVNSSALFGEYSLLILVFTLPFLLFPNFIREFKIPRFAALIVVCISFLNIILSNSRSPFFLVFLALILLLIFLLLRGMFQSSMKLILFFTLVTLIFSAGVNLPGLGTLEERLADVDLGNLTASKVATGEGINRGVIFAFATERIADGSWWLGSGYGTFETNSISWFGESGMSLYGQGGESTYDIHSLYFALVMTFGWVGAVCFILLILIAIVKLVRLTKITENTLVYPINLGLIFFWVLFLINEYKVNTLFSVSFFMLIWIWLGLSYAFIRTYSSGSVNLLKKENT